MEISATLATCWRPCPRAPPPAYLLSVKMSTFQPSRRAASLTFCPLRPMALVSWSSGTMTSRRLFGSSTTMRVTSAGASALRA